MQNGMVEPKDALFPSEVEGIAVEADPVKNIARHVRLEIERVFGLSKTYVPS